MSVRTDVKRVLATATTRGSAEGATLLIYHRVGGGSGDELDVSRAHFASQLDVLDGHQVVHLDDALDTLDRGDADPQVVLTFDDGFGDVFVNAWPLLRERRLPFTLYLASRYVGATMRWEGSTANGPAATGLTWPQLQEMVDSGLCTIGNHTDSHVRPAALTETELDACTHAVESRLGVTPRHFAYPWGIPVPSMETALRARFRSAATGRLGRNPPGADPMRLTRVPVRGSDPIGFFRAKIEGGLFAERVYDRLTVTAKRVGIRG